MIVKLLKLKTMKNNELRAIMQKAWQIRKNAVLMYGEGIIFADCLKQAWAKLHTTNKLVNKMRESVVWFEYLKVDGTTRRACGTLRADLIPQTNTTSARRPCEDVQTYYDIEKQSFRCFRKENLLKIY